MIDSFRARELAVLTVVVVGAGCTNIDPEPTFDERIETARGDQEMSAPGRRGTLRTTTLHIDKEAVPVTVEEIDGEYILEGDIILDETIFSNLSNHKSKASQYGQVASPLASTSSSLFWPDGLVPYTIDSRLSDPSRVTNAIAHWEQNTAVRFVPRTTQTAYVTFRPGSGCSATVGRTGRQQFVNLASSCSTGTTIHEIGHALGIWHEQTRADRDQYVTIHFENIQSGYEREFGQYTSGADVGTYDFGSIMHYPSNAFSRNGRPTITKKDGSSIAGQRNGLSPGDIAAIATMYGPTGAPAPAPAPKPDPSPSPLPRPRVRTSVTLTGSLAKLEIDRFGPYRVAAGTTFSAKMTGTGDADLYVRFGSAPTLSTFHCRPYVDSSEETCSLTVPTGQNSAYVMIRGYRAATYRTTVTYTP